MTGKNAFDPEATRLARVNVVTGEEIPLEDSRGLSGDELERTVIGRAVRPAAPKARSTAEFIPLEGVRATGETTAVWEEEKTRGHLLERTALLLGSMARLRGKRRAMMLIAALAACAGLLLVGGREGHGEEAEPALPTGETARRIEPVETPTSEEVEGIGREDQGEAFLVQGEGTQEATEAEEPLASARLHLAVGALLDGRMEEAARRYQTLLAVDPQDESIGLAVEILKEELKKEPVP